MDSIIIKGAKVHNLKNVDVTIPRNKLTVITGLSGSGKSSLAFDTIFAEGQRRYVESLSAYARQFIAQMEKPEVESIEGLSPAISIDQKTAPRNPRSTVGTITEIYDYMRLLWAKVGKVHCTQCGKELRKQSASQIVSVIASLPEGKKIFLLAPIIIGRKGSHVKIIDAIRREGFVRMRIDGQIVTVDEEMELDPKKSHTIEIIVDRMVLKDMATKEGTVNPNRTRLADSIELTLKKGEGSMILLDADSGEERRFSEEFVCPDHPEEDIASIEPRSFSFNSPHGACEECHGLGSILRINEQTIIPNPSLSLAEGAIHPWATSATRMGFMMRILESVAREAGFSMNIPWEKLPDAAKEIVLRGYDHPLTVTMQGEAFNGTYDTTYEGVIPNLERRHNETDSSYVRTQIEEYMEELPCNSCNGMRLKRSVLGVTVGGKNIVASTDLSVTAAKQFFEGLIPTKETAKAGPSDSVLSDYEFAVVKKVLREIIARLSFLENVGLNYLTLSRSAATLSGGEAQRIRLATQIGSALQGVLYVLDEPSIGLHQRDNARLIGTLTKLRDLGNTVIVVEHDEETIRSADFLLEIGPGAGKYGGEIIGQGTPEDLINNAKSITGQYLKGTKTIPIPGKRRKGGGKTITIRDAHLHNLQHLDVSFPLGTFIGITGVSGSGKSSLIHGILGPELLHTLNKAHARGQNVKAIEGMEHLDKAIMIDQSPIGRTPRSNPATYTGIFTDIRDLFASTPEAKLRGYKTGRFSFNVKGGRCEDCEGDGLKRIEMHFLPDVFVTCETCHGQRYNHETLEITYKGHSVADALDMTIREAIDFFSAIPALKKKLQMLEDVGLGYIHLGQSATTLSGGEAQRVKLATELMRRATGKTFYILDEPTTGLHFDDIQKLLTVLQRLVDKGNTVLVIEHNLDVIKCVDHVLDLGPEGGDLGGRIIAQGTPEDIARAEESFTGQYLKKMLEKK
ncbi:TPA: excinuclease ABC subunit UvrA [Candidatus Peribacteria bacterium]|nr:MAG: excinuclease ABC subunit A [Candidatus Peribacteria bacterium RIFOXYD2_FULL_58_15]HAI98826.1 excinuclease ABC subunit UvrA [Candidatus Peribacteria bacterium]HAS34052.1 excinuclease ABC subunit UvrA [Candidatus Peribacteria bacterium]